MTQQSNKDKTCITKDRIIDAAESVFYERGYSKTSLNEIAEQAGMTRGAIYWHFKNKEDLFNAMTTRVMGPHLEMLMRIAATRSSEPLKQLSELRTLIFRQVKENIHVQRVFSILFHRCEFTAETEKIIVQQKLWQQHVDVLVETSLINAQKNGQIPQDLDIQLARRMMVFMFNGLLSLWLFMPESFDLIEDGTTIYNAIDDLFSNSIHLKCK